MDRRDDLRSPPATTAAAPRPRRGRRLLMRCARLAVVLIVGAAAGSWVLGSLLIAPAQTSVGPPPEDLVAKTIRLACSDDLELAAWHVDAPGERGCVVLLHGLRGSRGCMTARARMLLRAGYSSLLVDLRGHGESDGDRITMGACERRDVRAAIRHARAAHPDEPLAVLGVSLGGVAAVLAAPLDVDAVIAESIYHTIDDAVHHRVATRFGAFSDLPTALLLLQVPLRLDASCAELRPVDAVARLTCPLFLISGADDPFSTADETRAIFAAAREPKRLWLVPDTAHQDLHAAAGAAYETRVLEFLESAFANAGPRHR